jgi:hypothetical protein
MTQTEIMDEYILFLRSRYQKPLLSKKGKFIDVRNEPFIGIWKDRDDLVDSRTWLRALRKSEWRITSV